MPGDRVLLLNDSVKEEPNLAVTLLRGLALPRDCEQVPIELIPGLGEMCSHLVPAGQDALKAYDKATKVQAERERYRSDRDSYKTKWRILEQQAKDEEAEVEQLKTQLVEVNDQLVEANAAKLNAEAKMKRLNEEEKEKLKAADAKGYETDIKRAAMEYTRVAYKMVNEALEDRLPDFYKRGYAVGAYTMAGVMMIQPESGFLRQLLEPMVPDLELPYTEEDCAPLPPEDDEDEEMAETSGKD